MIAEEYNFTRHTNAGIIFFIVFSSLSSSSHRHKSHVFDITVLWIHWMFLAQRFGFMKYIWR